MLLKIAPILLVSSIAIFPLADLKGNQPCKLSDYPCIASYLSEHSNCDPVVYGSIPHTFGVNYVSFQVPYVNATFIDQFAITRNIGKCYVSAFFVNETSDVAVMGINCPDLTFDVNRLIIQHYPNDEDQFFSIKITSQFSLIQFTANIRPATSINICRDGLIYTYITALPKYQITQNDPESGRFISTDENGSLDHLSVYVREEFLTQGPPIFRLFVDYLLCDFGCSYNYNV